MEDRNNEISTLVFLEMQVYLATCNFTHVNAVAKCNLI